jgi:hypothetical protein
VICSQCSSLLALIIRLGYQGIACELASSLSSLPPASRATAQVVSGLVMALGRSLGGEQGWFDERLRPVRVD